MRTDKGSWSGRLRHKADYPETPERLAAQFLRVTAHRFLNNNASDEELDMAVQEWRTIRENA